MSVALLGGMSSCNKWLDVDADTRVGENVMFESGNGMRIALNGIYSSLSESKLYGQELTWGLVSVLARDYNNSYLPNDYRDSYLLHATTGWKESYTTKIIDPVWNKAYNTLANVNNLLQAVEKTEESPLSIASATGIPGETVVVDVSIINNPGIVSANLKVAFDEGLTLVGATNGDVFSTLTYIPPKQLSSGGQITSSCQFAWTGFDIATEDIKDGIILSLYFKISEEAEIGDCYNVTISSESGDVIDKDLNSVILNAKSSVEVVEAEVKEPNAIDDFEYELTADGIIITAYNGSATDVIIGESYEIDGATYNVVEIAESAFEGNETIISIVIPATVEIIGDYAFYDCTSLIAVTVLGKDTEIGEIALGYYYISRREDGVVEGFTIYGYEGSTAEEYASMEDEITFVVPVDKKKVEIISLTSEEVFKMLKQ